MDPADPLLNPGAVLLGARVCEKNADIAKGFVNWMIDVNGGQKVVENFKKPNTTEYLYTPAPVCEKDPKQCAGW